MSITYSKFSYIKVQQVNQNPLRSSTAESDFPISQQLHRLELTRSFFFLPILIRFFIAINIINIVLNVLTKHPSTIINQLVLLVQSYDKNVKTSINTIIHFTIRYTNFYLNNHMGIPGRSSSLLIALMRGSRRWKSIEP